MMLLVLEGDKDASPVAVHIYESANCSKQLLNIIWRYVHSHDISWLTRMVYIFSHASELDRRKRLASEIAPTSAIFPLYKSRLSTRFPPPLRFTFF